MSLIELRFGCWFYLLGAMGVVALGRSLELYRISFSHRRDDRVLMDVDCIVLMLR